MLVVVVVPPRATLPVTSRDQQLRRHRANKPSSPPWKSLVVWNESSTWMSVFVFQPLDGKSLVPLLTGTGSLEPRAIHWHFPCYLQAWACVRVPWRTTPVGVVRKGDWKLMEFFEDGRLELYNLKDDVGETVNLAQVIPEKTKELHADMRAWRKEINAPIPTDPNPAYDPSERWIADPKYRGRAPHILPQGLGGYFDKALGLGYH